MLENRSYFNPLISNGMRRFSHPMLVDFARFQSTHPKRDETGPKKVVTFCKLFQSTHPKRDETFEEKHYRSKIDGFQSTHPKRDETFEEKHYRSKIDGFQSTHPKRDETRRKSKSEKRRPYFNPLIPNGMRLQDCVKNIYIIIFQSTHPKRDETVIIIYNPVFFNISIHSSQTG